MQMGTILRVWSQRSLVSRFQLFTLESLFEPGKHFDQNVLIDGKPLLLNVWATWCPTCRAEHQYLNQLAEQGVRVVGLNYKE